MIFFFYWLVNMLSFFFFFNDTATTEIYTLSLHDALPASLRARSSPAPGTRSTPAPSGPCTARSEEHTSELQSRRDLVCRLLVEKKKHPSQKQPVGSGKTRQEEIKSPGNKKQ